MQKMEEIKFFNFWQKINYFLTKLADYAWKLNDDH